jgi:Phage derived protein Gp49-like (DUF891)
MNKARRYRYGFTARGRAGHRCSIGYAASTRTTGALSGSTSCECNSAGRLEAPGGKPQRWSLGSALVAFEQADCPAHPCFHDQMLIVLHGFIKKAQKTPGDDLALAKRRMKEVTK